MKQIQTNILKGRGKMQILFIAALVILLPIFFVAIYIVQTSSSQASASCPPLNIHIKRTTASTAQISFDTSCSVKAQINCAIARGGIKFFCGGDEAPATSHIISTEEVTLSSNTGYYAFIDTGLSVPALGYIPASPSDRTYGLNFESLDAETMGTTAQDEGYDPALDINQDGVINVIDKVEFYDDVK